MKKKDLLQLIFDLQHRVSELEKAKNAPRYNPLDVIGPGRLPDVFIPSVWTIDTCSDGTTNHQYPFPWHGTVPPACTKCGKASPLSPPYVVTSTTSFTTSTSEDEDPDYSSDD